MEGVYVRGGEGRGGKDEGQERKGGEEWRKKWKKRELMVREKIEGMGRRGGGL